MLKDVFYKLVNDIFFVKQILAKLTFLTTISLQYERDYIEHFILSLGFEYLNFSLANLCFHL